MPRRVIVDSGPFVALFNGRDQDHQRAVTFLRDFDGRFYSTMAVVTEVMYLLDFSHTAQADFLRWAFAGAFEIVELIKEDLDRVIQIHAKFADRPIDFADATLVAIADRLEIREAITLDNDFRIYRYRKRHAFKTPLLETI